MPGSSSATPSDAALDAAWTILLAASRAAAAAEEANIVGAFALTDGELAPISAPSGDAVLAWRPGIGWDPLIPPSDPRQPLIDLYLPIASATPGRPITIGHLGQSLDGFIATHSGDSQFVTGEENILHLHRMRALCDAVIVGAGTVAADDPQLTTRLVAGPNPVRVVLDPTGRLAGAFKVFTDDSAETLYISTTGAVPAGETQLSRAAIVTVHEAPDSGLDLNAVLQLLRQRGCHRIFVEGGGVTVSTFLQADLLDRLQMAIAPLIIGNGRPAIRLPACAALSECRRPKYRVFRMGGDVLFDCDLRDIGEGPENGGDALPLLARII